MMGLGGSGYPTTLRGFSLRALAWGPGFGSGRDAARRSETE